MIFEHWERGFESHSRQGRMYAFLCVALCCVGRGHAMDRSLNQGVLPKCVEGSKFQKLILNRRGPGGPNS
jgi:hypothetical protein